MKPRKNHGKIGTDTIFQTGYKMEKWCLSLFCVVLTILITLQDVSYALSPPSRFRPIPDLEKQSNQPYAAPPQAEAETVFAPAPDVLKPQKEPDSDPINNNQEEEKKLAAQGALDYLLGYIAAI